MKRYLRLWFTFEDPMDRRTYFLHGLALIAVKFAGDSLIVWAGTGRLWDPFEYQSSISRLLTGPLKDASPAALAALVLWSMPFLWAGISMSMRRALDAGFTAWFALLFFVPFLKYVLMLGLCIAPSQEQPDAQRSRPRPYEKQLPGALMAIILGTGLGLGLLVFSVTIGGYGAALFLGTPFVVGAVTAWLFNRRYPASGRETQSVVLMTEACIAGVALVTAIEGLLCLLMAAPLAVALGAMGAYLGRSLALFDHEPLPYVIVGVMSVPMTAAIDAKAPATELREVRTVIQVNAPAEDVWRNVIEFPPLPQPGDLVFRAGISYPMRAEIRGEGVGAVRYCVFSTGAFVEPITHWEPGRRLSFNVTSQPRPMEEWSPYEGITPPHLDGFFESKRGEFRLVPLPDGRTRLEGSTWYEMKLQPAMYWSLFGDAFIHRIHDRVLEHIRTTAEGGVSRELESKDGVILGR